MTESKRSATHICALSLLLLIGTLGNNSSAAPGDVDLSFDPGSGVNGPVNAVAVQPDGKVIIGGSFTTVKGLQRFKVARLNADGSGDSSFNPSLAELNNVDWYVSSVVLQSDGKVLIGGNFIVGSFYGIARLNANGTLDRSFDSSEVNATLTSMALQPDGKVLIGGAVLVKDPNNFGTNLHGIVRLNANGTVDTSFNEVTIGYASAYSLALQPDGKVLVGGYLLNTNGIQYGIARLNANGSVDGSFNPGTGANSIVRSIALQTDLKILIGGDTGIARLNANGSLDSSFNSGIQATNYYNPSAVFSIAVQPDGKAVVGGFFRSDTNPNNRTNIARLNADGSLDGSFNPGTSANWDVHSVVLQSNGKVLIGGYFTTFNGTNRNRIARLNADGGIDSSFDPGTGIESSFSSLVMQPDGKLLLGGVFTFINGTNRYGSLRLNADGSLDGTFVPDTNFNPGFGKHYQDCGPDWECYDITTATAAAVQPDGKLVVGVRSEFWQCDPAGGGCNFFVSYSVVRLNANGSRDSSFNFTNTSSLGAVSSIALQSDGKVIIGSAFSSFKIARLNADGSLDGSFNPGTGPNAAVTSVALQPDGKVLIGGYFGAVNGTNRNGIARLNANGSLDNTFDPAGGSNGGVTALALQSNGKVVIGGGFTTVNGTNRNRIARLNANGSLDTSFNPGTGADGSVRAIALQSDGKVLIGGDFTMVNGVVRPHVARLYGDSTLPLLSIARSNSSVIVRWPVTALNFQLQGSTNLSLANGWTPAAESRSTNNGFISVTSPATNTHKFFRLSSP